jgi:hypothetical protein
MENNSIYKGQNVPAPTGGYFIPIFCNIPEESFILSSSCNSVPTLFLSLTFQLLLLHDLGATYLIPVPDMEEAGNGLLSPGIILHGLRILLFLDVLASYLITVPNVEEIGNGLLPPGIILLTI